MSDTAHDLLAQLLQACDFTGQRATRLAAVPTLDDSLRSLLIARAVQYRRAAIEIGSMLDGELARPLQRPRLMDEMAEVDAIDDEAVMSQWERAECYSLTCFRDAFDAGLPTPVSDVVKRHFERGLAGLAELRALQTRVAG
jgi:hypothetical protein